MIQKCSSLRSKSIMMKKEKEKEKVTKKVQKLLRVNIKIITS
jgi:hypothetical protein